jgi:uncharacterized protein YegP (UPF0339 family)
MIEFQIHRSQNARQPYFLRVVAENGKILASSETYEHKADVNNAVALIRNGAAEAKYIDHTGNS